MKISYSHYTIFEGINIETKEHLFQLKHWYIYDITLDLAGAREIGLFKSIEEAKEAHKKIMEEKKNAPAHNRGNSLTERLTLYCGYNDLISIII